MLKTKELSTYKNKLEQRYHKLIERSNDYKYVDESMSDHACYKALKTLEKLNRIRYLENSFV